MRTLLQILIVATVLGGLAEAQVSWWKWPGKWIRIQFTAVDPGPLVPDYLGETVDGRPVTIEDYRGRVTVLAF